jgi:iron uptake system EfeUOB component EfeO/EfeM
MLAFMRPPRPLAAAATTVVLAAGLAACSGGPAQPANLVTMTSDACGGTWHVAGPGWHTLQVRNGNDVGGEVDLTNPATGGVYAEIAGFGPQTTTPMSLDFGSGQYAFRCLFQDTDPMLGSTVTIPGHATGTPAQLPVPYNTLVQPAKQYQDYIEGGLTTLLRLVTRLNGDIQAGSLGAARRDWLPAHLQYQRLGAAYDAFGDFDDEIDGRADALGVTSPRWTGFYRLEYGLWHGQPAAELKPVAATLKSDVAQLLAGWPHQEIELIDIGLRTHEVLENALQFQLSGHDDYGSGTTLATTLANIDGTRELLSVLRPILVPHYPALPAVYTWLDRLQAALLKERSPGGQWTPVAALSPAARQQIDAACDQALTELAPIASITEPRN